MVSPPAITATFNLVSGDCYKFKVNDAYGDGVTDGTGSTGFTLIDSQSDTLIYKLADYGSGTTIPFGVNPPQPDSSDVYGNTTGIMQAPAAAIAVYPNPASGTINITLPAAESTGDYTVHLTNALGRMLLTEKTTARHIQLDAAGLPTGVYFLDVQSGEKRYSGKIMVSF
jgi:hypothetical protein